MRHILFLILSLLPHVLPTQIIICTNDFTPIGNKCLKLFTTPTSRRSASKTCAEYAGNLVTIKNHDENFAISALVKNSTKHVWIGLYCFEKNLTTCLWDNGQGSAEFYNNFVLSSPIGDIYKCVFYKINEPWNGHWMSGDCSQEMRSFVCEIATTFEDSCSLSFNGSCYLPSGDLLNTAQSFGLDSTQKICQENNASLVSIHSANENRFIQNYYEGMDRDSILLGAVKGRNFSWMDGTDWDFHNVDPDEGTCLKLSLQNNGSRSKGRWYSTLCEQSHYFMCKRPAGIFVPATTITETSVSQCNKVLLMSGTFSSPNSSENYSNCMYTLQTLGGQRIRITFSKINMENGYVHINDGEEGIQVKLAGNYTQPFNYYSQSNVVKVVFMTDDEDSRFVAKFFSVF